MPILRGPRWQGMLWLVGGLVLLGVAPGAVLAQQPYVNNLFPVAPRELRQHLTRAQAALQEERFSDAVAELGQVLHSADSDDFFLGDPGSPDAQVSLKTQALALLGTLPPRGRQMYELQFGAEAKAALEAAVTSGDLAQITEVSRRYFHTQAGYEATLLLGRFELDRGRPLAAALALKRLAESPSALAQYDPELSVLLATAWLHAGQAAQAEAVLHGLKQRLPQARVRAVEREVPLFIRNDEALAWLSGLVGGPRSGFASTTTQWTLHRGDERRNARVAGGVPLLNYNWKLPTINDPGDEARALQQYRALRDRDEPLVCALSPLVVQDYAIVRQPESNKLIGISLKRQGKREWVYPPFDENPTVQAARQAIQAGRGPLANVREAELRQRIWEDHAFGQVSSDGRRVFLLDELGFAPTPNVNIPPIGIGPRGVRIPNPSATKPYNLLVALDLQKQGYQLWAVGGMTGDNPALAGAFFLGPPLPVQDQLYALAEFTGEIRLVCLDARTGNLEWKQQLAVLDEEREQIVWDRSRRLAGASPSLAEGILVCPTSAGAVVAVDLATRTLRWGYQYPRSDMAAIYRGGFRAQIGTVSNNAGGGWLDATATIAEGCVILTPCESQQLHCLDLLTGKARWAPIPRDEMLFVACVHEGKIILVGKNRVRAVRLADGEPAWAADVSLEGEVTAGRGYYDGRYYYLPLTGRQLCLIDLDQGKIAGRAPTEIELGNLVCYQNELISLSPQAVASFVLLSDQLKRELQTRLAANPQDLDALALKAQILLQEGQPDEALTLLRQAQKLAPQQAKLRHLLVKVLLALVRQDHQTHLALTEELEQLVTDPLQRREVLRWRAEGLMQAGRIAEAMTALLELADQELAAAAAGSLEQELQSVERHRLARPDRWLAGQFAQLYRQADSATREELARHIQQRLEQAAAAGPLTALRTFVSLFSFHPHAVSARQMLLARLLAADALLEAELVAGDLIDHPQPEVAGPARAALALVYEKARRYELAAALYEDLGVRFASVVCRDGLTGAQLRRQAGEQGPVQAALAAHWPLGKVDVREQETGNNLAAQRMVYPVTLTHLTGAAPRGLKAHYDPSQLTLSLRSETGQVLATASLRSGDGLARPLYVAGLTGKANGHLVVLNVGTNVAALHGLSQQREGEALLWRKEATDLDPNNPAAQRIYSSSRPSRNPLLGNRPVSFEASGRLNFSTGPVLSVGVAFQRGRQIVCVDPLTGQSLWETSLPPQTPLPTQTEIFGDEELLFVADGRLDSKNDQVLVLSTLDGRLMDRRQLEPPERRWATWGRHVLAWEEREGQVALRLYDAASGRDLWTATVPRTSRGCLIDGEEVAILQPDGQFQIISLATGRVQLACRLEPAASGLAWISVLRSRQQYLLLASQDSIPTPQSVQPLPITNNVQQSRMHGRVYAFDRATGRPQWLVPAVVAHHALPPDQPVESPLVLFVGMRQASNKMSTAVLALDRRTGEAVYQQDLSNAIAVTCDIVAEPTRQTVTLALIGQANRTLTFQFTSQPRPPQPPAQLGQATGRNEQPLAGMVDLDVGEAIRALNRGLRPQALLPFPRNVNEQAAQQR